MAKKVFGKPMGGMPLTPGKSPFASTGAAKAGMMGKAPKTPAARMAPPAAPLMPPKVKPGKAAGVPPFMMGKKKKGY
jgi:hypothetical protein